MPVVKIPPPYQGPTEGRAVIDVTGATVVECIEAVCKRFVGFRELIFDASGKVHKFVTLYVNGDEIERTALATPVAAGDEVAILAAIAGG